MNSTYAVEEGYIPSRKSNGDVNSRKNRFNAMSNKEHRKLGHIKDSTNSWIDPNNYIDSYYMDW